MSSEKEVHSLIRLLPKEEKYALAQQMMRAGVSLTNNIAEGYGRFHWQETAQFMRQARGSLAELVDDLNVCQDESYADARRLMAMKEHAEQVLRLINGYVRYLKRKKAES